MDGIAWTLFAMLLCNWAVWVCMAVCKDVAETFAGGVTSAVTFTEPGLKNTATFALVMFWPEPGAFAEFTCVTITPFTVSSRALLTVAFD